jgi:hypothetical protein
MDEVAMELLLERRRLFIGIRYLCFEREMDGRGYGS